MIYLFVIRSYTKEIQIAKTERNDLEWFFATSNCCDIVLNYVFPRFFRQQHFLNDLEENDFDEVIEIMSNAHLNNNFLNLARELDIMDAKTPDDVYKSHLDNVRPVFGGGKIGFLTF